MYHQIGKFRRPSAHRAIFCHVRRFKAQMAYLHYLGYNVISLENAVEALFGGGDLPNHSVVLTFDDGYQNFREHAFPVLERYGFPAIVFLVAGLLGKDAKWLADEGRHAPHLMNSATINELRSNGISFGSHTMTHPRLTRLDRSGQINEISKSKSLLEDLLGENIKYFCYPGGEYDEHVVNTVKDAGYEAALTCDRGAATSLDDPITLPRKAISYGDSLIGYFWKLHMKHKKKLAKQYQTPNL